MMAKVRRLATSLFNFFGSTLIIFGFNLSARYPHLFCIHDDNMIARVDVWRVLRFMFASQTNGDFTRQTTEHFVGCIHNEPVTFDGLRFGTKGLHLDKL